MTQALRRAVGAAAALLLVGACTVAPQAGAERTVRVFAVGPKFSPGWVDTPAHFRDKLLALTDARLRTPAAPGIQQGAADVASRLLGPADPARPAATARDLVTLPEDLGLMAAFTGSRGAQARASTDLTGAIVALIGAYAPVGAYYAARFPALAARPFPPTRLLAVSLTDTFVRTAVESFAALADRLDAYVVAGVALAQDWRVICTDRATYVPPPGAGPCAVQDPGLVAFLRSPDEPGRTYAYQATTPKASTMALVFDPDGHLVARTVKAYLTPTELPGQLDLVPGEVSGVQVIPTPVGRLGIVTSKDAWMPDVTAKLDEEHAEILVQPEFFVNDTVRRTGPWAPDTIQGAGPSDVLRHPSLRAAVLPQLTGNVFDFSADSQQAIVVRPGPAATTPSGAMVGQPPTPGYAVVGRWPVPDPLTAAEPFAARRARLGAAGEAMLPTSPVACADEFVAGPCRGGQVEDVIAADVRVGAVPPRHRRPARRHGPGPVTASRPIAPAAAAQRNASVAARGRVLVVAYEQADRVRVVRSRDGGRHWERSAPVAAGPGPQWWPQAAIGPDGTVWVAWQDAGRIRVAHSAAGGAARAGRLRLRAVLAMPAAAGARQWRPAIAATGPGRAFVAWVDERARFATDDLPQAGIFGARVQDDAVGAPVRLDRTDGVAPLAATLDNAWAPSVAARDGHVLLTWVDFRSYDWDVEARDSADGGATFGPERTVNDTPADVEALEDTPRAAITAAGRGLIAYTDWFKDPASATTPSRLYDTRVAGFGAHPVQADDHGGAHVSTFAPALAPTASGDALVAWQDAAAAGRIRLARLRAPAGTRGRVLRVDDGGRDGAPRARPELALAGPQAVVVWEDGRDGPSRLYAARVPVARVP